MIKGTEGQVRWLKTALQWKIHPEQRQRILLLRENGMTQPFSETPRTLPVSFVSRHTHPGDEGMVEHAAPTPSRHQRE